MINSFFHLSSSFQTDLVVLAALCIVFFVYAFYFGRSRIIALILAFYPAVFFFEKFPFLNNFMILKNQLDLNKILIFALFLILFQIAVSRYIFAESGYGDNPHMLRNLGFAVAATVLVLVFSYSIASLDFIYTFSPNVANLFSTPTDIFWWTLAPMAILFFL